MPHFCIIQRFMIPICCFTSSIPKTISNVSKLFLSQPVNSYFNLAVTVTHLSNVKLIKKPPFFCFFLWNVWSFCVVIVSVTLKTLFGFTDPRWHSWTRSVTRLISRIWRNLTVFTTWQLYANDSSSVTCLTVKFRRFSNQASPVDLIKMLMSLN